MSFPEEDPAWSPGADVSPAPWSPPIKQNLKRTWDEEEEASADVLKDLLRVKKLSQRVDSNESECATLKSTTMFLNLSPQATASRP